MTSRRRRRCRSRPAPLASSVFDLGYYDFARWAALDAAGWRIVTKRRRALELFFKWIEQNLKIEHFLGASENAVRIQGAVAPVAYLLLRPAKADRGAVKSPLAFAPLVRANLMRRKRIDQLTAPRIPPPEYNNQTAIQWPQTRTGHQRTCSGYDGRGVPV